MVFGYISLAKAYTVLHLNLLLLLLAMVRLLLFIDKIIESCVWRKAVDRQYLKLKTATRTHGTSGTETDKCGMSQPKEKGERSDF